MSCSCKNCVELQIVIARHKEAGAYMLDRLDNPVDTMRVQAILNGEDERDSVCPNCGRRGLFPGPDTLYITGDEETCAACGAICMIDWEGEEDTLEMRRRISTVVTDRR